MTETALDRVARALDLIPFIAQNPGLSVVEIAPKFNTSPTQISKDLSLLHMCGLPGYSHLELLDIDYEDPNFISVGEAQVLDKPRALTQTESLTLVLGLNILLELTSNAEEKDAILNLREKISSLVKEELIKSISTTEAIDESPVVSVIRDALTRKINLKITYDSARSDSITERLIHPLTLRFSHGAGYLDAISLTDSRELTFKVSRILSVELDSSAITKPFTNVSNASSSDLTQEEVELVFGADGYFFQEVHNEIVTSVIEEGGSIRLTLQVQIGEWLLRTLLAWPHHVEVTKPLYFKDQYRDRVRKTLENYQ